MNAQLAPVIAEVGGIQKPKAAAEIVAHARRYVAAMGSITKPVTRISVTAHQYSVLFDAASKAREKHDPVICGLSIDKIPVERA